MEGSQHLMTMKFGYSFITYDYEIVARFYVKGAKEMKCFMCGWEGHPDELVAVIEEPETINDFVYCPICTCDVWGEEDGESNK